MKQLLTLHHAFVERNLRYSIVEWGNALKTHLKSLKIKQRRLLKIIWGKNSNKKKFSTLRKHMYYYILLL